MKAGKFIGYTSKYVTDEIDAIVSYNFHHINRNKTKTLIPLINEKHGFKGMIMFFTAEEVFEYAQFYFKDEENLGPMDTIEAEVDAIRQKIMGGNKAYDS